MSPPMTRREALLAGAVAVPSLQSGGSAPRRKRESPMRLGIVTYNIAKDWDLPTILDVCRSVGLKAVEFRTTHSHGIEPALGSAARAEVRKRCADAGLEQTSLGTICEFHSPDPGVVEHNLASCRAFCDLAHDIGARGVKVRPNGLPEGVAPTRTLEQIGRALNACGAIARELGVEIWMEVHGAATCLPANARAIMDACDHPSVGITWNSNASDVVNGSIDEAYRLLGTRIRCCHITELWNDYPWRELAERLKAARYDRFHLAELPFSMRPEDARPLLRCYSALWREIAR